METEQILALLRETFKGARPDGLQQLAAIIGLQAQTDQEARDIVSRLTEDGVKSFITDWRRRTDAEITKATKSHDEALKAKYNLVEKQPKEQPTDEQKAAPQDPSAAPVELTAETVARIVEERIKAVTDQLTQREAAQTYRARFTQELDKAEIKGAQRNMLLRNFERVGTFKTPEEFDTYLAETGADIAAMRQEASDLKLSEATTPIYGAPDTEGISKGVADFIASQKAEAPEGKPL